MHASAPARYSSLDRHRHRMLGDDYDCDYTASYQQSISPLLPPPPPLLVEFSLPPSPSSLSPPSPALSVITKQCTCRAADSACTHASQLAPERWSMRSEGRMHRGRGQKRTRHTYHIPPSPHPRFSPTTTTTTTTTTTAVQCKDTGWTAGLRGGGGGL
jgi:hypothetical protein